MTMAEDNMHRIFSAGSPFIHLQPHLALSLTVSFYSVAWDNGKGVQGIEAVGLF